MQIRTFVLAVVIVVIGALLAWGHRPTHGGMLHRLGTAIHGR